MSAEQKTDLELLTEAQARVSELETRISTLNGTIASLEADKAELLEKVVRYSGQSDKLTAQIATQIAELNELKPKVAGLEKDLETAKASTDSKAREIAARMGANLPPKAPGAGDQTTDNTPTAGKTARERLSAIFQPKS